MSDTIVSRFFELAKSEPRRTLFRAQVSGSKAPCFADVSRGGFWTGVLELRDRLVDAGVRKGDRILVVLPNGLAFAALDLACQAAGAVSLVIHPAVDRDVMERVAAKTAPRLVVARATGFASLAGVASLDPSEIDAALSAKRNDLEIRRSADLAECAPDDVATVMCTSGTTGEPRGAMLTHGGLVSNAAATCEALDIGPEDRIPALLSFSHSAGRTALLHAALLSGATVAILDRIDVEADLAALAATRPTVIVAVPRVIELLLAARSRDDSECARNALENVRLALVGGASLTQANADELERRGIPVYEAYGSTEATCTVTLNRPGARRRGTVGSPLPGMEVRIASDGEILCRGPSVMAGFWGDPDATAEVLDSEGWLHTGDLGSLDADGFLRIEGRKKDVFLARDGEHFAPSRIEALLETVPGISEAIVCGDGEPFVSALVFPDFEAFREAAVEPHSSCPRAPVCTRTHADLAGCHRLSRLLQSDVDRRINASLSPARRVNRIRLVSEGFPPEVRSLTPTAKLKIDRGSVLERYAALIDDIYSKRDSDLEAARAAFRVPADPLMREVARFHANWTAPPGVPTVDTDFFARVIGLEGSSFPDDGSSAVDLLRRFESFVAGGSIPVGRKSFAAHMVSALPTIGIAAEALMAVLNQNQVSADASPATSALERQTVGWLADLAGYDPKAASGIGTAGGSIANITALLAARNRTHPRSRSSGFAGAGDAGVIVVSRRMHYSFRRAAELLGLGGERGLVTIPVDATNRIRVDELRRILDELDVAKRPVIALVAIAGTSETGNVDPISLMADIADERGLWLHVDAAMGAAALASPRQRPRFAGIERAHSITVDPHKWFYVPYHCAYVLFREREFMRHLELCDSRFVVLRDDDPDLGKWSIEGSRAANALKFWMVAQALGRRGYAALVERQIELNLELASLLDRSEDLQRLSVPELNILCFRFVPARCRELLAELEAGGQHALRMNSWLDRINVRIQRKLARSGEAFLSRTTLESGPQGMPVVALRAVLFNPHLDVSDLEEILRRVATAGWAIVEGAGEGDPTESEGGLSCDTRS